MVRILRPARCKDALLFLWKEWLRGEGEFLDRSPADEVLLDDSFKNLRRAVAIPGAFGINDGDGAVGANFQAIGFGAVDAARANEAKFIEPRFKISPRCGA